MKFVYLVAVWLLTAVLSGGCTRDTAVNLEELATRARTGELAAITRLVDLLAEPEGQVAEQAYPAVVAAGAAAIPVLLDKVDTADRQQREYVIAALGTIKAPTAVPALGRVLADRGGERRYVAAWALGEIASPDGIPALLGALDDPNNEVPALCHPGPDQDQPPGGSAADHPPARRQRGKCRRGDPGPGRYCRPDSSRGTACPRGWPAAGGGLPGPRQAPRPARRSDPDQGTERWRLAVRMNAAMALGPLGGPRAAAGLRHTLADEVHVVREWSARSLEMITGQPVLYRNAKDELVRPYNVYH